MFKIIKISDFPKEKLLFLACSIITILGALFIRLRGLDDLYYFSDEVWHLVVASKRTIAEVLEYNFQQEVHPPLSPLIWHFMLKISDNILWIRSASYVPAILLIPTLYILGNLTIGRAAGFTMAVIAAFGALDINSGVTVRAYPLMLLALAWAGIFMYKYIANQNKKYLVWYFAMVFIAIELVHSAAFLIIPYGLLLMWDAYKKKSKKEFLVITFGHMFLAACTVGYAYIIKNYYGFEGNYGYFFSSADIFDYLLNSLRITIAFLRKLLSLGDGNVSFYIFSFLLAVMPFILIKNKRQDLLCIVYIPLILVIITNYLVIYPFPIIMRNNLFLFIPFLLLFGFIAQKLYNFLLKYIKNEHHFLITAFIVIAIPLIWFVHDFRNPYVGSTKAVGEYYIPKKQFQRYLNYVNALKKDGNILVLENQMIWYFNYLERESAKVEYLTDHLGHFKSDNYEFYFSGFPGRQADILLSYYDLEKFASDLLVELKKNGRLANVKNIIYSHIGGDYTILGGVMKTGIILQNNPGRQLTAPPEKKSEFDLIKEIITSKQVNIKVYERSATNSYITIVGMTPEFLKENIIGKEFIDVKTLLKKRLVGN